MDNNIQNQSLSVVRPVTSIVLATLMAVSFSSAMAIPSGTDTTRGSSPSITRRICVAVMSSFILCSASLFLKNLGLPLLNPGRLPPGLGPPGGL